MLERLSLLLLLLARWCISLAVRSAPDGAAVILAVSHGGGAWSLLLHRGTPEQATQVAIEARRQAGIAEERVRGTQLLKKT